MAAADPGAAGAVLGTPIERLEPVAGPALLISDLHVPADGGAAFDHLRLALAAARGQRARLFVLGDLFDSYVSPAQATVGVWRDVAAALRETAQDGVAIDLLVGNRDFLLGPEFAAASGARLHRGGLRLHLAGAETLLLHGDELCQDDLPYQRAKRWLRSGALRFVARRLPLSLALRAAARARRKSARVIASGDQSRFLPTRGALEAALAGGVERLVFGHIHRHTETAVAGGHAVSLPAFDATAIGYRATGGELGPVRFTAAGCEPASVPVSSLAAGASIVTGS